jgi:hypothetical protein
MTDIVKLSIKTGMTLAGTYAFTEADDDGDYVTYQDHLKVIESLRSRAEKAEAELSRRTANPADYRYWEGRYRDEKADNERLEAACEKLAAALERLCDYSNAEYVPNILFELASDALSEYRKEVSE